MNWTPGPARCRSDEYEAEIAFTDMPGKWPIHGRVRRLGQEWQQYSWMESGQRYSDVKCPHDLMPPTITREALAEECMEIYYDPQKAPSWFLSMECVVAHVIDAVKAGRVE